MNSSGQALAYIFCILIGTVIGALGERRRQKKKEVKYNENGHGK